MLKDILDNLQTIITIGAIVVGGIWSYLLFIRNRQRFPRASVSHVVTSKSISNDKILLHVTVIITNLGNVLLSLKKFEIRVQQVIPVPVTILADINNGKNLVPLGQSEISWPLIQSHQVELNKDHYEIESGETQEIHCDFVINANIRTIIIYSYVKNQMKWHREIGWDTTTLYDFNIQKDMSNE